MKESELILTAVRGCRRVDLYTDPRPLTSEEEVCFAKAQARRAQGEPVSYILGECEFMGLFLKVDARVLIPRPETEILVEQILLAFAHRQKETLRILDLGTGSGNIAIALTKNLSNASVVTVDISRDALSVARENAVRHGVAERIQFVEGDIHDFLQNKIPEAGDQFDLVVSNPPYVPSDEIDYLSLVVRHEPRLALDGGIAGLRFYEPIIRAAGYLLKTGGMLFLECGDGQAEAIGKLFSAYSKYKGVKFIQDYVGMNRVVIANV